MDYNKLAAIEHEMAKKFGDEVVQHPRAKWSEKDEEVFIQQTTDMHAKFGNLSIEKAYTNKKGYLISKKLLNEEHSASVEACPYCTKYKFHFNVMDDVSINKFGCCLTCYYRHIEGREDRWNEGWRPNK